MVLGPSAAVQRPGIARRLLVLTALVSVPAASDLRLAINVAVGTILPLIVAAVLYQSLVTNRGGERLAGARAAAAANCFVSWRQQTSEYDDTYKQYMADKDKFWASQSPCLGSGDLRGPAPGAPASGYFYHPNVMASFLLWAWRTRAVAGWVGGVRHAMVRAVC